MATLTFEDLRQSAEVFLSEWSVLGVRDEPLIATGEEGAVYVSAWDNWLLPPHPDGIEPLVQNRGYAMIQDTDYVITKAGDSTRTILTITAPKGPDGIILATYRRNMFRKSFWENNLRMAIAGTYQRLMMAVPSLATLELDDQTSPWPIVIKQAGKNALINLQTFLAGLGKTQMENIVIDLSRAHSMVHEAIDDLEGDIDREVVAWRWANSPVMRMVKLRCPSQIEMSYRRR